MGAEIACSKCKTKENFKTVKRLTNSDRQTDRPTAMGMMSNHVGAPKLSGALCTVERSYWSVAKNITK